MSLDERIPGTGSQRVDVQSAAAPGRTHHKPPVRRPPPLADEAEQVLREERRYGIVSKQGSAPGPLGERPVKDVKRRVVRGSVLRIVAVLDESGKGEPHRVAIIVRSDLLQQGSINH